ncbi:MAG: response regulator [Sandaracinaceae bacterium]|nr:response regulator [Sandaracinaceae bacterium]
MTTETHESWIMRLGAIGDRPEDTDAQRLQHRLLVYMGVLMSGGGLLWGSIAASQSLFLPAVIPYSYTVVTFFNLLFFRMSKSFPVVQLLQVFISLLLPFLFQWSLGGFAPSGAVMLWAMMAMVGSMTFSSSRAALYWLILYVILTVISGLIDSVVREHFSPDPSEGIRTFFFTTNVTIISSCVFGLMIYLIGERERATDALARANQRITELNEHLEDEVAARTSELRAALARSKAVLDHMADGLVAVDHDGVIGAANPALSKILFLDHDLAGKQASAVLPEELAALARRSIEACEVSKTEIVLTGERTGVAVASPIQTKECVGSVVILRDVTLEKEIDRMKTDFIATVSHELRTPLTSVLGFAKLTKNKLEQAVFTHVPTTDAKAQRALSQVRGNIDIIVSEGQRLTTLINDVLDISKMEAGRMEWKMAPLEPAALVARASEATSALFSGPDVVMRTETEPDLPQLEGDFDRLLQVLINLISNAAKFTDKGSVTVRARRVGGSVELSVTDTGYGIDVADQAAVFEKFKQVGDTLTNKPKGTGLGLPICRQIVTAHGGTIGVESTLGTGSTFRVLLPVQRVARTSTPPAGPTAGSDLDTFLRRVETMVDHALPQTGGDVLVVDDDPSLREMLRQQLGERGYEVRLAKNGYEAIQSARAKRPDVVVLDVMMPEISGFDVAAVLKSDPQTHGIPIIILSIVQDAERGYRLGVEKYLTKPTEADVLVSEVHRVLAKNRGGRRVLVVDPDPPTASDVEQVLRSRGFEVIGTTSSRDALAVVRGQRPDLVIVEVASAEGQALVRAIRLEKDLEHVHVVQLLDKDRPHGAS